MNVTHQIAQIAQNLPAEKQVEVLDFVEFLVARQSRNSWTVEQRQTIANRTIGSLAGTQTSSGAFAKRKQEETASRSD